LTAAHSVLAVGGAWFNSPLVGRIQWEALGTVNLQFEHYLLPVLYPIRNTTRAHSTLRAIHRGRSPTRRLSS
jgi:hypothetical protein